MEIVNPTGVIGTAGGLALSWSSKVSISVINTTDSQIDVIVTCNSSNNVWMFSGTYGFPYKIRKHTSWEYFQKLSSSIDVPWLVLGDLNFTLNGEEKTGGKPTDQTKSCFFNKLVNDAELMDLGFFEYKYTWYNKRENIKDFIEARLDRALANPRWLNLYPRDLVYHLPSVGSDHKPILLRTTPCWKDGAKPFKFFGIYMEEPSCFHVI